MASLTTWLLSVAVTFYHVTSQVDPMSHNGTTPNIKQVFEGRCWDYDVTKYNNLLPRVTADCDELWSYFFQAFSYMPPCAVGQEQYLPFLTAAKQTLPEDKVMFWSGVYSLAHRFAENGARYITLEDTLIGYLANSLVWCGQSISPGMNYTRCPNWDDCPSEASESFWAGASSTFASLAKGQITLMIDGSNPDKQAYRRDSFFGKYELPNLRVQEVDNVSIIVVHALDKPKLEICGKGSVQTLQEDISARGLKSSCEDDPAAVLHLMCADDPTSRECRLTVAHATGKLTYPKSKHRAFNQMPDIFS